MLSVLLFALPFVGVAVQKINAITLDTQVNLNVIRFEDHISIQCSPATSDTASRTQWKAICNEMATPHINQLVVDGAIKPISGPKRFRLAPTRTADWNIGGPKKSLIKQAEARKPTAA